MIVSLLVVMVAYVLNVLRTANKAGITLTDEPSDIDPVSLHAVPEVSSHPHTITRPVNISILACSAIDYSERNQDTGVQEVADEAGEDEEEDKDVAEDKGGHSKDD
uniref:Uncharacterized protein n=1 Tax=Tetraselmis chuii TaxID=63592 RepID=A0A7S1SWW0_9CHLO|mmetsp:Transcript_32201/g.57640  ORF Transcript_32201/g.57640 Transcript_32201/m.57640 type:complete len:106 (+) Transcript_32201:400-717(+)